MAHLCSILSPWKQVQIGHADAVSAGTVVNTWQKLVELIDANVDCSVIID
jgi:hypothetical protein